MRKNKIPDSILQQKSFEALSRGNPYKKIFTHFYVDMQDRYLLQNGSVKTEEELNLAYIDTAKKDIQSGYNDRMVGYYDKWYRYSRADEGRAYDIGCQLAMESPDCSDEFHIIEVNNCF